MRLALLLSLSLLIAPMLSCSTSSKDDDASIGDINDEADKDLDEKSSKEKGSSDEVADLDNSESKTPPQQNPSESASNAGETMSAQGEGAMSMPTGPVTVTGLDYKALADGGTVVIQTSGVAAFRTRSNPQSQQFIVEVSNAQLPAKFKRPYNTKEFVGSIAGIQAYQNPGSSTARFVVQMRDGTEPNVYQDGNQILISTSDIAGAEVARGGVSTEKKEETDDTPSLNNRNLDEFLLGQSRFYGKKISIQFKDADIREVFNFLSEESGLNIILSDDVTGKMNLKLRQIPWDQALIVIMKSKGLGYVRQGNILRIAPLKTLQQEADAARSVIESQAKLKPLKVRVFTVSYAKVKDLEGQAKEFLSERGRVKGDDRTNSLIVSDLDENIEKIGKLIEYLDTQTPQVLIEAKVVEARTEFQKRVGINWNIQNGTVPMGQSSDNVPIGLVPNVTVATSGGEDNHFGVKIGTFDMLGDLDATLHLFELEGIAKVLSSPRIATLNGKEASIEQSSQVAIFKRDTNPTTGIVTISPSFRDLKLKLEVTPQITAEGGVIMQVQVLREFAGTELATGDTPVNSRKAQTNLLVNNGQTAVMGGIFQSDVIDSESGIPLLRKIPILGNLFKSHAIRKEKNELLIFLTPRILNKEKAFRQAKGGG